MEISTNHLIWKVVHEGILKLILTVSNVSNVLRVVTSDIAMISNHYAAQLAKCSLQGKEKEMPH